MAPLNPLYAFDYSGQNSRTGMTAMDKVPRYNPQTDRNVPDRFELFTLADGEKKVEERPDTRVPNASLFIMNKEDHTLGNLITARLNNPSTQHIEFAGYRVPHPLFPTVELRIQTDGALTPRQALIEACQNLVSDLSTFSVELTKEVELRKLATEAVGDSR